MELNAREKSLFFYSNEKLSINSQNMITYSWVTTFSNSKLKKITKIIHLKSQLINFEILINDQRTTLIR